MFNRVFVESEGNNEFYSSLGKKVITVRFGDDLEQINSDDLVIFSGGIDINPLLYREKPHPRTQVQSEVLGGRDLLCIALWNKSKRMGCRVLGICRGAQHIAAMNGVKLIQHLSPSEQGRRGVDINGSKFWIPKCHHQAVPLSDKLDAIAVTKRDDAEFYEVFSCDDGRVLAVQGHPEWCDVNEDLPKWIRNQLGVTQ